MSAPIRGTDLAHFLVSLHRDRRTGLLRVQADKSCTYVHLQDGEVIFAEEGSLSDALGRLLVRDGKLTEEQYSQIIDRMTASLVDNEQVRFGEVAIELGFLNPSDVNNALANQVRQKVVHCLQWDPVQFEFEENAETVQGSAKFPANTTHIVMEGIHRFYSVERTDAILAPFLDRYVHPAVPVSQIVDRLRLLPAEVRFVRGIDGTKILRVLVDSGNLDSLHARRLVLGLMICESVELTSQAAKSQRKGSANALPRVNTEVPSDPPDPRNSDAPVDTRREPSNVIAEDPWDAARRRAAEIALQVQRRHGGDAPPMQPRESTPDDMRTRLNAAQSFQKGQVHAGYGAWALAYKEYSRAQDLCPEEPEYRLHVGWSRFRMATSPEERETAIEALREIEEQAYRLDQEIPFLWYVRGQLALLDENDRVAERAFRRAVKLNPRDTESVRHIRLLVGRRGGKSSR